ncbi:MAG: ATP-dependent DNA ligase [Myxococcales bacterium]|nr:ATP-dependent DNA ligase [Myxococcales bacterium]
MPKYSLDNARTVGQGNLAPPGSVTDAALASAISRYKRGVASRYTALVPDEVGARLPPGPYFVSPKIDGEQWCLVFDEGDVFFANPNGRVLAGDIPVLAEARKLASRTVGTTVVAGELYATRDSGRSRHGDLAAALGTDTGTTGVERVGFQAFDVVWGGDADARMPLGDYQSRLALLERLFRGGERLRPVTTEDAPDQAKVDALFEAWAADGKAEGLVVRTKAMPGVYKIKPTVTIDAAVIGYTQRSIDATQVGSLLMALIREDGQFQVLGHCGNLGSEDDRRALLQRVAKLECESNYSEANSRGALFQLVRPELVIEVRITDVQAESTSGDIVPRMVLDFEGDRWVARQRLPGVSVLHPRLERVRDDKRPIASDVPVRQVLERVMLPDLDKAATTADLPQSEILRRDVFTKVAKGVTAVRKLVLWQTNKHDLDPLYPNFVVHFTDYSPGRKDPLKRTVRLAPTKDIAMQIAEAMIDKEIKKGWTKL